MTNIEIMMIGSCQNIMMIVIVDLFLISGTEKSFHHTLRIMDRHALDHIHHLQCYEGHRSVKGFQELCDSLYFLFYGKYVHFILQ